MPTRRRTLWILAGLVAAGVLGWLVVGERLAPEPPLDDIDAESRRQLDQVLRDAERTE